MDKLDAGLSIQPVSFLLLSMANENALNIIFFLYWKSLSLYYNIQLVSRRHLPLLRVLDVAISSIHCLLFSSITLSSPPSVTLLLGSQGAFTHHHHSYQKDEPVSFRGSSLPPSVLAIYKSTCHHCSQCSHYLESPCNIGFKAPKLPFRLCHLL